MRVAGGRIQEIGACSPTTLTTDPMPVYDHGPGALMPAPVNAHTHLELSGFKGKLNCTRGFGSWVQELLELREESSPAELTAGAREGLRESLAAGTGAICDISSLGLSAAPVAASGLYGLWCREILGNLTTVPDTAPLESAGRIRSALAAHAPHTTSSALLRHLKQRNTRLRLPFSIHLAESDVETEFITSGRGAWADFLTSRDIEFSSWELPVRSPVAYLDNLGVLDEHTLAVHVLQADASDLDLLRQRRTSVCVCPRSNQMLHDRLPDIAAMLVRGIRPCLGTDSLASTPSLDLFDEMAFIAAHYETIAPAQILAMATTNGAAALAQSAIGRLDLGFAAWMVYVPVTGPTEDQILETTVHKGFTEPCRPIFGTVAANSGETPCN
jgi:cytosine/adenosine deaminase-related metal-dependent hydrolase